MCAQSSRGGRRGQRKKQQEKDEKRQEEVFLRQHLEAQRPGVSLSQVLGNVNAHAAQCIYLIQLDGHHLRTAARICW